MTLTQKIIESIYRISEDHDIWLGDECHFIEHLIETIGLPMSGESYVAIRTRLFTSVMKPVMKKLGVEFTATEMAQNIPAMKLGPNVRYWNGGRV